MQGMAPITSLPDELGQRLREPREASRLGKKALAKRAGKVREVIYRLEAGEDMTVSALLAVHSALGMGLRIERVGLPTQEEVTVRFLRDEDDDVVR
jgi:HTH-type transcriptional regulator/antitoxin HipB